MTVSGDGQEYKIVIIRIPVEWVKIIDRAVIEADAQSLNAFVMMLFNRSPEVVKEWEKAGRPALPPMVKRWGDGNRFRSNAVKAPARTAPKQILWGRPLKTDDDE